MSTRVQLTLFVPQAAATPIEDVRRLLDPAQHALIAAHVTLCREDELHDTTGLLDRLCGAPPEALDLTFGEAEPFEGHGWLLPCTSGAADYQALRASILGGSIRTPTPHLTLAHPRNPRAPGNSAATARQLPWPLHVRFDALALIEQRDRAAWRTLWSVPLGPRG